MANIVSTENLNDLRNSMIKYRAKENLTQKSLADRCGLSLATIQSVENGWNKPTAKTYMQIKTVVEPNEA